MQARFVKLRPHIQTVAEKHKGPIVLVVGAVSKGQPCSFCTNTGLELNYLDDCICISRYPLSAALCVSKIINEFEVAWDIN